MKIARGLQAIAAAVLVAASAHAQDGPLKVGIVAPMSGPFASYGKQIENGVNVFLRENGDSIAGRKLQLIYRDSAGPNPELAKRHSTDLVVNEKVDILAGLTFTPEAFAVAPVATQAKKPTFILLASTSSVSTKSPYYLRTSYTIPQTAYPMGIWAAKNKVRKAFVLVADYAPGHDAETWFKKGFVENGGQVVGELRVAPNSRDFSAYLQRVADAQPDAVFVFLQAGDPVVAFMKGFRDRGLDKKGMKVLATEGWADDDTLAAVGDAAVGAISSGFYSSAHPSAQNRQFVANYSNVSGGRMLPNFVAVAAYDAMRAIAYAVQKQGGKADPDATVAALKGYKFDSPRGPLVIDANTRDPVHNVYNPVDIHRATDAVLVQLDALANSHPHLLFLATSNFPQAIDGAFTSRCDLVVEVPPPGPQAAQQILRQCLASLGETFPAIARLAENKTSLEELANAAAGLDGRTLRKLVVNALAMRKETAMDPSRLAITDLVSAAKLAQQGRTAGNGGRL